MALFKMKSQYGKRGGVKYKGTTSNGLVQASHDFTATSLDNYALFAGGKINASGYNVSKKVSAYNSSLVRSTPVDLNMARCYLQSGITGDYAIFGEGDNSGGGFVECMDAYNRSLVRTTPAYLSKPRYSCGVATINNNCLFAGGFNRNSGFDSGYKATKIVDVYNNSLTRSTIENLSQQRCNFEGTTVGNYALFGGGMVYGSGPGVQGSYKVDVYDTSLTHSVISDLTSKGYPAHAITVNNKALISHDNLYVDVYDNSLTKLNYIILPNQMYKYYTNASLKNYGIYAGGSDNNYDRSDTTVIVDKSLTITYGEPLSVARSYPASTSIGKYILIGGGMESSYNNSVDTVDVYEVA